MSRAWATYPYDGTVVLVTGAGSGIGRAVARAFLEQGASVALVGRAGAGLVEAAAGYDSRRVLVMPADVDEPGAAALVVDAALRRFSRLDVVVAAAGASAVSPSDSVAPDGRERARSSNLGAVIELVAACTAALRASRGNIVAISAATGARGEWGRSACGAPRAALNALVQGVALDLGGHGVRMNAVSPGFTTSRPAADRPDDHELTEQLVGRVTGPDDIARAVLFVASPDAASITGAIIPVDGGMSASHGPARPG